MSKFNASYATPVIGKYSKRETLINATNSLDNMKLIHSGLILSVAVAAIVVVCSNDSRYLLVQVNGGNESNESGNMIRFQ